MISSFLELSQLTLYFVKCRRTLNNTYKFFLPKTSSHGKFQIHKKSLVIRATKSHLYGSCCNFIRSIHTRRQVAATCQDDTSQRQIGSCVLENFCENHSLCNRILSQEHVAKNQIRQNLCDLSRRQNSVAKTKIFTKFLQYTRSDLLLRCVAATCCCNLSPDLYTESNIE